MKKLSPFFIIAAGILWGAIGIFVRRLNSSELSSLDISLIRSVCSAIILLTIHLIIDAKGMRIRLKDIWMFIGTGIFSIVFFNSCYFTAMNYTSLSIAAILLYTAPAFVMIMSIILFKEKLTPAKLAALVLSFTGCIFVSGLFSENSLSLSTAGLLFGTGAGFGYALYSIFGTYALKKYKPLTMATYTFLFACIGSLPFSDIPHIYSVFKADSSLLIYAVLLGIISTVLPYLLYNLGLKYVPAGTASIMASVEPVSATLWGLIIFNEPMSIWNITGLIFVLASIVLLNLTKTL